MYKLFLTVRYLTRRLLAIVAVLALALSVTALVLAPSIMNGFQIEFHKRVRGTLSDLTVSSPQPFGLEQSPALEARLAALPNVVAVAPFLENPALDKHLRKIDYCFLRGVDPRQEAKVSRLAEYLISEREAYLTVNRYERRKDSKVPEERDFAARIKARAEQFPDAVDPEEVYGWLERGHPDRPDLPTCVVGVYFLDAWDLLPGDTVTLTTASPAGEINEDREFLIVGALRTGFSENDRRSVVLSIPTFQAFAQVQGRVSGYSLKLADFEQAAETKQAVLQAFFAGALDADVSRLQVQTWEERNQTLLRAVAMEKALIRIITFCIVIAATASILLVMFMSVHTKVRELGILRAIGGTRRGVLSLFVGQGFAIAGLGMAVGLGAGMFLSVYINEVATQVEKVTGWHPFPKDIYYLDRIPSVISWPENAQNFVVVLTLGSLAAFVPGFLAAFRPPLKAIRHD